MTKLKIHLEHASDFISHWSQKKKNEKKKYWSFQIPKHVDRTAKRSKHLLSEILLISLLVHSSLVPAKLFSN